MTLEDAMAAHASNTVTANGHRVVIQEPTRRARSLMTDWPPEERAIALILASATDSDASALKSRAAEVLASWTEPQRTAFTIWLGDTA